VTEVFADTSGWAAFFVRSQAFHAEASVLMRRWQTRRTVVVTTNYVLTELVALLVSRVRVPHARRLAITSAIRSATWVEVVHIDPTLDADAWNLLGQRSDKDWSLVDCASFTVMSRRGIADALTTDHHFEQAGYTRLLK
jgi:predicted nucleic acid-binding protein